MFDFAIRSEYLFSGIMRRLLHDYFIFTTFPHQIDVFADIAIKIGVVSSRFLYIFVPNNFVRRIIAKL